MMADDRIWKRCAFLNNNKQCHVHKSHKRAWGVWYGEVGRKPPRKAKR